jgi:hypothetical protein
MRSNGDFHGMIAEAGGDDLLREKCGEGTCCQKSEREESEKFHGWEIEWRSLKSKVRRRLWTAAVIRRFLMR